MRTASSLDDGITRRGGGLQSGLRIAGTHRPGRRDRVCLTAISDLLMMGEVVAESRGVSESAAHDAGVSVASSSRPPLSRIAGRSVSSACWLRARAVRYLLGPAHRHVLPGCVLAGAAFLPLCDTLARNAMYWIEGRSRRCPVGWCADESAGRLGFFSCTCW